MKTFVLSCALTLVAGSLSACHSRSAPNVRGSDNSYLIQDEVEAFFSGTMFSPVPVPPPTSPGMPSGDDYGNGGGYGVPYDNQQALQQAIQFFV